MTNLKALSQFALGDFHPIVLREKGVTLPDGSDGGKEGSRRVKKDSLEGHDGRLFDIAAMQLQPFQVAL